MNFSVLVGFVGEGVVVTLLVVLRTAEMERELDLIPRRREEEKEDDLLGFRENGRENLEIGNGDLEEEGLVEKEIEEDVAAAMVDVSGEEKRKREREREERLRVNLNRLKNETRS